MPQVSLYLDEATMELLRRRAALGNASLSRYVSKLVQKDAETGWPEGFWDLFGSVDDGTFAPPPELSFALDAPREGF